MTHPSVFDVFSGVEGKILLLIQITFTPTLSVLNKKWILLQSLLLTIIFRVKQAKPIHNSGHSEEHLKYRQDLLKQQQLRWGVNAHRKQESK